MQHAICTSKLKFKIELSIYDKELVKTDMYEHLSSSVHIRKRNYRCKKGCSWLINMLFTAVVSNKNCNHCIWKENCISEIFEMIHMPMSTCTLRSCASHYSFFPLIHLPSLFVGFIKSLVFLTPPWHSKRTLCQENKWDADRVYNVS